MGDWVAVSTLQSVLNGLWQGLAIALLAWVALRSIRTNAATRYVVWWAVLASTILLPFVSAVVRTGSSQPITGAGQTNALVTIPDPSRWALWALGIWMAGAVLMLVRVAWSYVFLQRVKRAANPVDGWHQERLEALLTVNRSGRQVRAAWSDGIRVPIAAGVCDPAILLPASLADCLSPAEFDQILAHEFAHLRRWDDWTNLVQKMIEAVFFFHPAVLWAGRNLNLEREIACDDWVIVPAGSARPYAACLTKVVELSGFAAAPRLAPGAGARKPQFSRRIESILARRVGLVNPHFSKLGICACSALVACAALAATQFMPIAIAMPSVPALRMASVGVRAPGMGYVQPKLSQLPSRKLVAHQRTRRTVDLAAGTRSPNAPTLVAARVAGQPGSTLTQYVFVQQWSVDQSRETNALCVYYFSDTAAGQVPAMRVARWLTVLWVHPETERIPADRM